MKNNKQTKRDIRFRAWDKENKTMSEVEQMISYSGGNEGYQLYLKGRKNSIDYPNKCELMQFTGLLDKHGKEMYEGDMVRRDSRDGEIRWDDFEARFRVYCDNARPIPCNYPVGSDWEVVGNVFENREMPRVGGGVYHSCGRKLQFIGQKHKCLSNPKLQQNMKIEELLNLSEKWADRIKELNPERYIDTEQLAGDIDNFLYWAYEELHPGEAIKKK